MLKAGCISGRRSSNRLRAAVSIFLALASVVCLNVTCLGQTANKVTAVRFWSTGDATRVAVEVSGEFKYKSDQLETPPRLFFDVQDARPQMAQKTIPVGDRLLKQIRIAETQPGTTRIVLDLEQDADFTASQLSNPERLMVELRSKGTKTSAAAAIEEPALQAQSETQPAAKTAPSASRARRGQPACGSNAHRSSIPKDRFGRNRKPQRAIPTGNGP